jgi:hypothetical protein
LIGQEGTNTPGCGGTARLLFYHPEGKLILFDRARAGFNLRAWIIHPVS